MKCDGGLNEVLQLISAYNFLQTCALRCARSEKVHGNTATAECTCSNLAH